MPSKNPNNHHCRLKSRFSEPMAKQPIAVLLAADVDEFVRSLPNRADWLRKAITEAYEREKLS